MTFPVELSVQLRPVWHLDPPRIRLGIDDQLEEIVLTHSTRFNLDFFGTKNQHQLNIDFLNKTDQDCRPEQNLDKAVVIESVDFFGIADPRFIWAGIYRPIYPEPWASRQKNQGIELAPLLGSQNYLGWNGQWTLTFDVPVFTWIHRLQNLGWIYD